jgi:hypothetical protein
VVGFSEGWCRVFWWYNNYLSLDFWIDPFKQLGCVHLTNILWNNALEIIVEDYILILYR